MVVLAVRIEPESFPFLLERPGIMRLRDCAALPSCFLPLFAFAFLPFLAAVVREAAQFSLPALLGLFRGFLGFCPFSFLLCVFGLLLGGIGRSLFEQSGELQSVESGVVSRYVRLIRSKIALYARSCCPILIA